MIVRLVVRETAILREMAAHPAFASLPPVALRLRPDGIMRRMKVWRQIGDFQEERPR
jgi:hypothetical protein